MKSDRQTKIILGAVVIALCLAAVLWFTQKNPPQKYTGPVEKIRVANHIEYGTLIWIAEHQGYFADNGLEVMLKDYPSGVVAAEALLADEADISLSANFVFVSHSFHNPDLRIIGTAANEENEDLIARKDKGIISPGDLKGRKIGVTKNSSAEYFLGTFLTFHDLSLADVEVVQTKPQEMVDFLSRGVVDAVLTWPPFASDVKKELGPNAISWPGQSGQRYYMTLLVKEKFLREKKGAAERFLRSLVQAEEFVNRHDEEAKKFIQERYHYEPSYMDKAWPQHQFVVTLPQGLLLIIEDDARWMVENNLTDATEIPNYLDFIYFDALEKVKPEAVTIMHEASV